MKEVGLARLLPHPRCGASTLMHEGRVYQVGRNSSIHSRIAALPIVSATTSPGGIEPHVSDHPVM